MPVGRDAREDAGSILLPLAYATICQSAPGLAPITPWLTMLMPFISHIAGVPSVQIAADHLDVLQPVERYGVVRGAG